MGRDLNAGGRSAAALGVLLLVLLGCGGAAPTRGGETEVAEVTEVTVYLVRHAEKETEPVGDPGLTGPGRARAEALAEQLAGRGIDRIVASQFRRTQATVEPLAARLGLEVEVVDAAAVDELAASLAAEAAGRSVVVAGHSNTVPELIARLGVEESVEIPEDRYGDLFVVSLGPDRARLERARFGHD